MIPSTERPRRERQLRVRSGRHRADPRPGGFDGGFMALAELALRGAQVSARVIDLGTGNLAFSVDDHIVLPTAGVGRVLLLIEAAARCTAGGSADLEVLERTHHDLAGGAGVWQHLHAPALPLADLAALVAATGDNLATNVLIRRLGLDVVRARAESLGIRRSALLDRARDLRGPDDAPEVSVGSSAELAVLLARLATGQTVDVATSARVTSWLRLGTDLSMVAAAFGLDPLAHTVDDHGVAAFNITGASPGVRSEAGVVRGPRAGVAYAATVQFDDTGIAARLQVLAAMRTIGFDLLEYVH